MAMLISLNSATSENLKANLAEEYFLLRTTNQIGHDQLRSVIRS